MYGMSKITTFTDVHQILAGLSRPASAVGPYKLDRLFAFMERLGNPQNKLRVIHVAGTSGKTSTCYYIAALLRAAGHTVGHTVSPHVDEVNERAQINLAVLDESEYCAVFNEFMELTSGFNIQLSYFEFLVAFAYWLFAKRGLDYAVVEVGVGGLLDGTNVVDRRDKVCVITDIGLDHTDILGKTLPEIATQKAGIIYPENHVFMHSQPDAVMDVVKQTCQQKSAELHVADSTPPLELRALPLFQQRNWLLAYSAVQYVLGRDQRGPLTLQNDEQTLLTYIPARMEVVKQDGKTIILDGSHNEQKMAALVKSMQQAYPNQTVPVLVAFGQNKSSSAAEAIRMLREISSDIVVTEFSAAQDEARSAIPASLLAEYAEAAQFEHITVQTDPVKAFEQLVNMAPSPVLVTGSFYILNSIRPLLTATGRGRVP